MCADSQSPPDVSGHLPVEAWARDITQVCEDIEQLGLQIVSTHRGVGEDAERTSRGWKLAERQSAEREALGTVVECVGRICEALEAAGRESSPDARRAAAQSIAEGLPDLERSFLIARRAALDLLLWTRREGHLEGSELPDRYRSAYARLISWSPVFKPWLEGFQERLLEHSDGEDASAAELLSVLSRFNATLETARRFVRAVADPPLELVFHETNLFLRDWERISGEDRASIASCLNDACGLLLYDRGEFGRRTEDAGHVLSADLDASLRMLPIDDWLVLFAVDEDPLFRELTVTLYRVVAASERDEAREQIIRHLHHKLGHESS